MSDNYQPVIGLEVHIELATLSKMFCGCKNEHFRVKPNTHTCPVCLGLPGALPVPNRKALDWTILVGLALGCAINKRSKFDRKHYNYPDLPKGYQISQYDEPLAINGVLQVTSDKKQVTNTRIRRVHLEEDTGKLVHRTIDGRDVSLVDFNRSGAPLMEIVTEPDLTSAKETVEFAKELQRVVRYLGVSGCDMEKGTMRLEANISLAKSEARSTKFETKLPGYKVEVKNLNSFKFVGKAIDYEIKRQIKMLDLGKTPRQETRGWKEKEKKTVHQRFKETDDDYRYFPEPDIPSMEFASGEIEKLRKEIPKLPEYYRDEFRKQAVRDNYIDQLISSNVQAEAALKIIEKAKTEKIGANDVVSVIVNKKLDLEKVKPSQVIKMVKAAKSSGVTDETQMAKWVDSAIENSPQAVSDYKSGKESAISALVGGVMKVSKGKAHPAVAREMLVQRLTK